MKLAYFNPYKDDYENDLSVENIKHLYQLRHFCNIHTDKAVIEHFKTTQKVISLLRYSIIHGSVNIEKILKSIEDDALNLISLLEDEAEEKNLEKQIKNGQVTDLFEELERCVASMCGIGTNKIKRRLSKLGKTDKVALIIRKLLDCEFTNINAKKNPYYADTKYYEKNNIIRELIELYEGQNILYGYAINNDPYIPRIYYFELPDGVQISWHSNEYIQCPQYQKTWDGQINSTLKKIEKYIMKHYPEIIY